MTNKVFCGVDEAGRGPIVGPLVMAAVVVDEIGRKKLEWLGVKDSKLLSSQAREDLFDRIREVVLDFRVEIIEPDAIDLSMIESNLNWLEAETSARMVSQLSPNKVIVDCPSINLEAYKQFFYNQLKKNVREKIELLVEHKADLNHIEVAAASIIAKVVRDRCIKRLQNEIGVDFGSGYLSDPKTQEFLNKYHDKFSYVFRKKWKPYQEIKKKQNQRSLDEF